MAKEGVGSGAWSVGSDEDAVPSISPERMEDRTPSESRVALVRAEPLPEGELMYTSLSNDEQADAAPAGDDDRVWEDAASLQELLTLPLGIVEKMIEVV